MQLDLIVTFFYIFCMKRASIHQLLVFFSRIIVFLLIYELLYVIFIILFHFNWDKSIILPFLALVVFLYLDIPVSRFLSEFYLRIFFQNVSAAIQSLLILNQKLNSLLDTGKIQDQLRFFLEKYTDGQGYAIYWLREDYLELVNTNLDKNLLPDLFQIQDPQTFMHVLKFQPYYRISKARKLDLVLDSFLSSVAKNFSDQALMVPIQSQISFKGVILVESGFRNWLQFANFRELFFRVIRKIADVSERSELYHEIFLQKVQSEKILEISKLITSTLNLSEVLNRIMESIQSVIPYDAGAIFLIDFKENVLKHIYSTGYFQTAQEAVHLKIHQGIVGKVIQSGKPINIPDVSKSPDYFSLRPSTKSQLTVPIFSGDQAIGAIALESDRLNNFTSNDVIFLQNIVSHAAIAISNAWLYQDVLQKREMEADLFHAASIQKELLISRIPFIQKLDMSVSSYPARIIGGDFYDIQKISDSEVFLSIGDVSGKGASGAILMAVCLAALRNFLKQIYSVCEIVARLNNFLVETTAPDRFVTLFLAYLNSEKGELIYTNAGHNPPILIREDGTTELLKSGGPLLGYKSSLEYVQDHILLNPGEVVVMYTDGIIEARVHDQEYGLERLVNLVKKFRKETAANIKRKIIEDVRNFKGTDEFDDDLTLLIIKRKE